MRTLTILTIMVLGLAQSALALVDFNSELVGDRAALGLWHFNEGSGTTIHDSSPVWFSPTGLYQEGGYEGDFTWGLETNPANSWDTGVFGSCLSTYADGIDTNEGAVSIWQWYQTGDVARPDMIPGPHNMGGLGVGNVKNITIEFWVNPQHPHTIDFSDTLHFNGLPRIVYKAGDYSVEFVNQKIQFSHHSRYIDGSDSSVMGDTLMATYTGDYFDTGADVTIIDPVELEIDTWTHIAITSDRTSHQTLDEVTMYQNGVMTHQESVPAMSMGNHLHLFLMSEWPGDFDAYTPLIPPRAGSFFHGKLDELRISCCIRPYAEPKLDPAASDWLWPYTGADTYTLALYHLDETTGRTAQDVAPVYGANDATTQSSSYTFDIYSNNDVVLPAFNRSYKVPGTSYQQAFRSSVLPEEWTKEVLSQLTVEAWIKLDEYHDDSAYGRVIIKRPNVFGLNMHYTRLHAYGQETLTPFGSFSVEGVVPLNKWTHVAMIYDCLSEKNYTQLYVNGKEVEYEPYRQHTLEGGELTFDTLYDGRLWHLPHLNGGQHFDWDKYPHDPLLNYAELYYNMPLFIAGRYSGDANKNFDGAIDEVRFSSITRRFNPLGLRIVGIAKDLSDNINLSIQAAGDNAIYLLKFGADLLNMTGWDVQPFSGDFAGVEYIDAGVVASNDQMFYQVEEFTATSQGHVAIAEKSVTVDADLSEWGQSDLLATRNNFYNNFLGDPIPYGQNDIYAAYDSATDTPTFYLAFEVDEVSASDKIEFAFTNPIDTMVYQIHIEKSGAVSYYKIDAAFNDDFLVWSYLDPTPGTGVTVSTATAGGIWSGELKVEYTSFIDPAYTFDAGEQRTVFVNRSSESGTQLGTTDPDGYPWAWQLAFGDWFGADLTYFDPEVGVTR
jgi:Concanavalin A-like lectin/glucanases superfamily